MPNRPDDPYARFPPAAAIGLLLMLAGGVALLFLSGTWHDWRQAALGALLLFALIGIAFGLKRLAARLSAATRPRDAVLPASAGPEPPPFDPIAFVEAVRRRNPEPALPQIEKPREREEGRDARPQKAISAETIRRLQDLRDHPATPPAEREAADETLKKRPRTKRRSTWRKGP